MNDTAKQLKNSKGDTLEAYYLTTDEVEMIKTGLIAKSVALDRQHIEARTEDAPDTYYKELSRRYTHLFCKFVK